MLDQLSAKGLEAAAQGVCSLPNIERLRQSGTSFANTITSNPVCRAARATLAAGMTSRGHGVHAVAPGKSETFSVEGDNAELRHYLARLARKSRCFSRCLWALTRAVALFVYAWDRRQRAKRAFPKLPAEVCDFVADFL